MRKRPPREEMLMSMAHVVAQRSTCSRRAVGAVLARHHRVISTGYNGAPSGLPHCIHEAEELRYCTPLQGAGPGCTVAVHAEANALIFAARYGVSTEGCELYVTDQPCLGCAKLIINAGAAHIYYDRPYRLSEGLDLLTRAGMKVSQFSWQR